MRQYAVAFCLTASLILKFVQNRAYERRPSTYAEPESYGWANPYSRNAVEYVLNFMRTCFLRFVIFAICIGFLIISQVQGQEKEFVNLQEIRKTLVFRSRIKITTEELNERLISEIRNRKVNFILTSEEEDSLKKVGGSNLLIKTIRENLPKKLGEQIVLYKKIY